MNRRLVGMAVFLMTMTACGKVQEIRENRAEARAERTEAAFEDAIVEAQGEGEREDDPNGALSDGAGTEPAGTTNEGAVAAKRVSPPPANPEKLNITYATHGSVEYGWQVPKNPRGVVYLFHGQGNSARMWSSRLPARQLAQGALDHGFAIVVFESQDRSGKKWVHTPDSIDLKNSGEILDTLRGNGTLPSGLKEFGVGISNGGGFVSLYGLINKIDAIGILAAAGGKQAFDMGGRKPAVYWVYGTNDDIIPYADIERNIRVCNERDIPYKIVVREPEALTVAHMMSVDGVDQAGAEEILGNMRRDGLVNAQGMIVAKLDDKRWPKTIPRRYVGKEKADAIRDQLAIAHAGHMVFSEQHKGMYDFFETLL